MAGDGSELVASKRKHEDEEEEEGQSEEVTSSDVGEEGEGEGEEFTGSDVEEGSTNHHADDSAKTSKTSNGVIYYTFSDDEDFLLDSGEKADSQVWENYFEQIHKSEGFDIVDFPGVTQMTPIVPIRWFKDDPSYHKELQALADFAIYEYNSANEAAYKVIDIVQVNSEVVAGIIYYFTLKVRNQRAGHEAPEEIFQAKVWNGITQNKLKLCRPQLNMAEN